MLDWIRRERHRLVADLQDCCRIASISSESPDGTQAMADWLTARLAGVLDEVEQVPVPGAPPAVVGTARGAGKQRVLLYSHYDVQPADPVGAWSSPPFEAALRDGAIVARGVADDKADVMARIHALEAFAAAGRELPCSIVWLCEGAEEIGSRGLGELLRAQPERFAADACLWESYLRREDDGRPEIGFGCRGIVSLELVLRTLRRDQHSAFASVFRSAPAELVRALSTLTSAEGLVTIDGMREDAVPLEPAALATLEPPSRDGVALDGVDPFLPGGGKELARRLVAEPTANIAGLVAGYTGDGVKTVLPAEARAKLDIRLVPDQHPERVVEQLRAHLDRRGFGDIAIEVRHSVPPARSDLDFPLGHAVTAAARERFGEPIVYPLVPGAGPVHVLMEALGMPTVMPPGSTRPSSGIHAVDESIRVDDYLEHVAFTVRALELLAP